MKEYVTVAGMVVSNIGAAVASVQWVDAAELYLRLLIGVGQLAVAAVTVLYIWRKAKQLKNKPKNEDEAL